MKVKVIKCTNDDRPLEIEFIFKKDFSEFDILKWSKDGLIPVDLPIVGEEFKLVASMF